jgi:hypothetical protein
MMKSFLLAVLAAATTFCSSYASEPQRGYRGFIEWDNSFCNLPYFDNSTGEYAKDLQWMIGLTTTHGYQINNNLFVGAGLLLNLGLPMLDGSFATFLNVRYDRSFNKFRPFGDIRIGYAIAGYAITEEQGGVYISPTVGHRFNWGKKFGVNIGAGLTIMSRKGGTDTFFTFRTGLEF